MARGKTFNRTLKIYLGKWAIKNINRQIFSIIQVFGWFWKYTLLSTQKHFFNSELKHSSTDGLNSADN